MWRRSSSLPQGIHFWNADYRMAWLLITRCARYALRDTIQ
ncbi:hypothetical protein VULLAG_LOCUS16008 [Vulpes lagopus]